MATTKSVLRFGLLSFAGIIACASSAFGAIVTTAINPANGHTYHLLDAANWTDSEAEAISLNGHLVTINDADENQWVFETFANFGDEFRTLWLGLNDAATEGSFVWASGEISSYTNWRSPEPNNSGDEDYTFMYHDNPDWNDFKDAAFYTTDTGADRFIFGVVEVGSSGIVPEPASVLVWTALAICVLTISRRRRIAQAH
jgi:hypothetical protein